MTLSPRVEERIRELAWDYVRFKRFQAQIRVLLGREIRNAIAEELERELGLDGTELETVRGIEAAGRVLAKKLRNEEEG